MTRELPHPSYGGPAFDPLDDFDDDRRGDELWDEGPPPTLTLTPVQQAVLGAAIAQGLRPPGRCDNRLTIARAFAAAAGLEWKPLQEQLEGNGGYCDCEVLLNVLATTDDDIGEPD